MAESATNYTQHITCAILPLSPKPQAAQSPQENPLPLSLVMVMVMVMVVGGGGGC